MLPNIRTVVVLVSFLMLPYAGSVSAAVVLDERDLDFLADNVPTFVGDLSLGSNEIYGSLYYFYLMENGTIVDAGDSMLFRIASGQVLESLTITLYAAPDFTDGLINFGVFSYLTLDSGSQPVSVPCGACVGMDILQLGTTPVGPLGEGTYTLSWLQQSASDGFVEWGLELVVGEATPSPVPVPAAAWLFATALIGLAGFVRRRPVG